MAKKFENKKLNKEDHAKVDKDAGVAREIVKGIGILGGCGLIIKNIKRVPWKNVRGTISKVFIRG